MTRVSTSALSRAKFSGTELIFGILGGLIREGTAAKVSGYDTADPGSSPSGNKLTVCILRGLNREVIAVLANASMALARQRTPLGCILMSTVVVQVWCSELG